MARLEVENAQLESGDDEAHHGAGHFRRPRSISPGRRAGESLPVRRRPFHHLSGEATVRARRDSAFLLLRLADRRPGSVRAAASDGELLERIRIIHAEDNAQGAPRITAELNDGAAPEDRVNHKRVARVMREAGL